VNTIFATACRKDTLHLTMYTFGAMNIFFAHSSMNPASVAQLISGDVNA